MFVYIPTPYALLWRELLKQLRGMPPKLRRPTPRPGLRYLGLVDLEDPAEGLRSWQRSKLLLPTSPVLRTNSGFTAVRLPRKFANDFDHEYPRHLPFVTVRRARHSEILDGRNRALPGAVLTTRRPNERRPERNRRRFDEKIPAGFRRVYALANRTINRPSEYLEVLEAWNTSGGDLQRFAGTLAINEAIDLAYGARARFLKEKVYGSALWTLPVGWDTLSRLWR